jgi:hypothetical protein
VRERKEPFLVPSWDFDLQLFGGSSAGGNIIGPGGAIALLHLNPGATPLTLANALLGYGTIGSNDTGLILYQGRGFTKWGFQLAPEPPAWGGSALVAGYSVTIFYTICDYARNAQMINNQPVWNQQSSEGNVTAVPPGAWWPCPAPADQSGTASDFNPLTATGPVLQVSRFAVGFRAVLTAVTGTPTGGAIVFGGGVP